MVMLTLDEIDIRTSNIARDKGTLHNKRVNTLVIDYYYKSTCNIKEKEI